MIITHPSNIVENISFIDLKKVFSGDITQWAQLGGDNKQITLLTRQSMTSGVGNMFRQLVYGDQNHKFAAKSLPFKSQQSH